LRPTGAGEGPAQLATSRVWVSRVRWWSPTWGHEHLSLVFEPAEGAEWVTPVPSRWNGKRSPRRRLRPDRGDVGWPPTREWRRGRGERLLTLQSCRVADVMTSSPRVVPARAGPHQAQAAVRGPVGERSEGAPRPGGLSIGNAAMRRDSASPVIVQGVRPPTRPVHGRRAAAMASTGLSSRQEQQVVLVRLAARWAASASAASRLWAPSKEDLAVPDPVAAERPGQAALPARLRPRHSRAVPRSSPARPAARARRARGGGCRAVAAGGGETSTSTVSVSHSTRTRPAASGRGRPVTGANRRRCASEDDLVLQPGPRTDLGARGRTLVGGDGGGSGPSQAGGGADVGQVRALRRRRPGLRPTFPMPASRTAQPRPEEAQLEEGGGREEPRSR